MELYKMLDLEESSEEYQILLVKRMSVTFDDTECQMLNFTNITSFHKFKQEEQKSKLLQALNTTIHHEMLSPLTTNVMIADRLLKTVEKEQHLQLIRLIMTCSNLALFHANDLLDYKIIQNGSFQPTFTSESVVEAILQTIQILEYTIQNSNLEVVLQQPYDKLSDYRFLIDKRRFQQVLLNLLTNASKFQKEGQILVSHSFKQLDILGSEYALEVKVKDGGIGVCPEDVGNLFKPFFKSENKLNRQHNPRGNGLGLSICKQICQALEGDIWYEQLEDDQYSFRIGSTFAFKMKAYKSSQKCRTKHKG